MDDFAERLKERIARRLEKLQLTPITAANKADLPRDTIRNIFRQDSLPRADTLAKIAEALETSVAYLVGETAYPNSPGSADDAWQAARTAIETAKPIPIIGLAEWGKPQPMRHTCEGEYLDLLFLNVPGFEEVGLGAVEVADDHADLLYPEGRLVVFAQREYAGLRDGDNVVVYSGPSKDGRDPNNEREVEITIRQLRMNKRRVKKNQGIPYHGATLVSLCSDEDKYPSYTAPKPGEPRPDHVMVMGVVVADVNFEIRPVEPTEFPSVVTAETQASFEEFQRKRPELFTEEGLAGAVEFLEQAGFLKPEDEKSDQSDGG